MRSTKALSALMMLEGNLTDAQVSSCFEFLIREGITAYDFKDRTQITIPEVLAKYPARIQYSLTYKQLSLGVSASTAHDFIITRIDGNSEEATIIIKIMDEFARICPNTIFAYVDYNGDSPKNLQKTTQALQLKWLFKYNYFGKAYLERYSREFFENMPCENREYVTDDMIRIDLCKDLFSPISAVMQEQVKEYLANSDIAIRFYDYKKFWID